jgi:hypothetical protein
MSELEVGKYDPVNDTIVIEGVTYDGELFRELGFRTMLGHVLRVESRDHGVVTVTRLREYEAQQGDCND